MVPSQNSFKHDFLASIVVFLVALPLCLGISIATGFPPAAGLISGVIGGIVVGYFAGCPLQVTGPAAGLITIIWEAVQQFGIESVGAIILLAGVMQISMGVLGLGLWFRAVSPAVIQGMLAGIGVMIFSSQFHVMVDDTPKSSGLENLLSIPGAIVKGVVPTDDTAHHLAAIIGLVTITCIIVWKLLPKRIKAIPAPLVAVVVATGVAFIFQLPINYVKVPSDLSASLHMFDLSNLSLLLDKQIIITAITVAFIASAETLLTATAVDQMTSKSKTNYNKEIMAQGVGNTLAGFLGVLPVTGVIVRSGANVQAGAETRKSTILHGVWILLFVILFPFVLEVVPVSCLAAILVYTGYKLINIESAKKLTNFGNSELFIYFATIVGIVTTNLLEGVMIGFGLSLLKQFYANSRLDIIEEPGPENKRINIYLYGTASFVTLPKLASRLEALPGGKDVCIHIEELLSIDHACIELLQNWEKQYQLKEGSVTLHWDSVMNKFSALSSKSKKHAKNMMESAK